MPGANQRGPRALSEILGDLFAARGYARLRATAELDRAWESAAGEPASRQTRVAGLRRGVLSVTVAHPALLEELAAFRKPALLEALRRDPAGASVHDIRFRVGPIDGDPAPEAPAPPIPPPPRRPRPARPTR